MCITACHMHELLNTGLKTAVLFLFPYQLQPNLICSLCLYHVKLLECRAKNKLFWLIYDCRRGVFLAVPSSRTNTHSIMCFIFNIREKRLSLKLSSRQHKAQRHIKAEQSTAAPILNLYWLTQWYDLFESWECGLCRHNVVHPSPMYQDYR